MDTNHRNKMMKKYENRRKIVIRHIGYLLIILSVLIIYDLSGIGCLVRYFFGISCPSCGMTRAIYAMFRLDFKASFSYNPMTIPVVAAVLIGIHKGLVKRKILVDIFLIIVAVMTLGTYLFKLFYT